jgi:hypothetical protein
MAAMPGAPASMQRGIRGGGAWAIRSRMIKQMPAQEGQLSLDGLLVAIQERLVVPAGYPDKFPAGRSPRRANGWPGQR